MTEKFPTATVVEDGSVNIDGDPIAATRGDLKSALKSIDNLTALLTRMCTKSKRRAVVVEGMFFQKEEGGGIRIFITADNTLDETDLAKAVLSGMEEMLKGALGDKVTA
jgi:predicted pyridoxine 5'-phosphate oxidase superfamily flavin-nucleotide-binding protein